MTTCTATLNNIQCQREPHARGLCAMHWTQQKRHGRIIRIEPTPGREQLGTPASERFASRIQPGGIDGQCWEWTGAIDKDGYGHFSDHSKNQYAHRWAWAHLVKELNPGTELDHMCMNTVCVRPSHLQPVTRAQHNNIGREQRQALKQNPGTAFTGGNAKPRSIKELAYAIRHELPNIMRGARITPINA